MERVDRVENPSRGGEGLRGEKRGQPGCVLGALFVSRNRVGYPAVTWPVDDGGDEGSGVCGVLAEHEGGW